MSSIFVICKKYFRKMSLFLTNNLKLTIYSQIHKLKAMQSYIQVNTTDLREDEYPVTVLLQDSEHFTQEIKLSTSLD